MNFLEYYYINRALEEKKHEKMIEKTLKMVLSFITIGKNLLFQPFSILNHKKLIYLN
jgi:hypothetical protein